MNRIKCRSFAGAWIEIDFIFSAVRLILVAPSRERGLKFHDCCRGIRNICRSFAGAWIEIINSFNLACLALSLLRGSVD